MEGVPLGMSDLIEGGVGEGVVRRADRVRTFHRFFGHVAAAWISRGQLARYFSKEAGLMTLA